MSARVDPNLSDLGEPHVHLVEAIVRVELAGQEQVDGRRAVDQRTGRQLTEQLLHDAVRQLVVGVQ